MPRSSGDRWQSRGLFGWLILPGALALLMLAAVPFPVWQALAFDVMAQHELPLTPPLPPPRPAVPGEPPAAARLQPAGPSPAAPAPPPEAPRQPRSLPAATRARMHACGLEWQKLKETGAAANKTWFEFAQICLLK